MENIFLNIKNSIFNRDYYKELNNKPLSYSLKYYLVFLLILSLIFAVVALVKTLPLFKTLKEVISEMENLFPPRLEITIKDGKASTNIPEPFFIRFPSEHKKSGKRKDLVNLLTINTKEKFSVEKFISYKTLFLLSSDSIGYLKDNGEIGVFSLSEIKKEVVINKENFSSFIKLMKGFLSLFFPFFAVIFYIIIYLLGAIKLLYLFFGALLVWLVAKIKKMEINYKKAYQLGIHLMTAPVIITNILNAISSRLTFRFLFSILLIIMAVLNLKKEAKEETPAVLTK